MMGLVGRYTAEPSPLNEEELQLELESKNIAPIDYARILAERKAHASCEAIAPKHEGGVTLVLGSDTIVDLDGEIMNKPKDEADACRMIGCLSGNVHHVHTGVAVYAVGGAIGSGEVRLMFSFTDSVRNVDN